MDNGLKMGTADVSALMFDSHIIGHEYTMDFSSDWVINPDNSEGITVTPTTITITKVKPNTWFIKSNYGFATANERNDFFIDKSFKLSGLQALWGDTVGGITVIVDNPIGDTRQNYYPTGIIISPIQGDTLLSHVYPWDMGIPTGSFKHVYGRTQNWNDYGYGYDEEVTMYNYACGYDNYPEVGLAFWTGVNGDASDDGYLTLTSPITIQSKDLYPVDLTTRESWKACVGDTQVYKKAKTFANALMRYNMAGLESGVYSEKIQGSTIPIVKSVWQEQHGPAGDAIAYVATARNIAPLYNNYVFPAIEDIQSLVTSGWPMKFWVKQKDTSSNGFWASVVAGFANSTITDPNYASCLFAKSDIRLASEEATITLNFSNSSAKFTLDKTFDYSTVENVVVNITAGSLRSLRDAFRQTKSLKSLSFNASGTGVILVHTLNGAFEYSALTTWPSGLVIDNAQQSGHSELTCGTAYAFNGCSFAIIGAPASDVSLLNTILLDDIPVQAFTGESILAINYILDFKFVTPSSNASLCLDVPNASTVFISNLNKGTWSLDGVVRNNVCNGNLSNLSIACTNYLLNNLFDLRKNTSESDYIESNLNSFRNWSVTSGTKTPVDWEVILGAGATARLNTPSGSAVTTIKVEVSGLQTGEEIYIYSGTTSQTSITDNGVHTIDLGSMNISFLEVLTKSSSSNHTIKIELMEHFKSELTSGLSSATLYLPATLSSKASSSALQSAQEKGWTVVFGNAN